MIVVRLKGGLGNQLFQYAAARRLAHNLNVPLKLDTCFLDRKTEKVIQRPFELDKFRIEAEIADPEEIAALRAKNFRNFLIPTTIRERYYWLHKPFLKKGGSYYLNGYWQSEKYFEDISHIIRGELAFNEPLTGDYFSQIRDRILSVNSVSVHFRRGDYVTNPKTNKYHGVCSAKYYEDAVDMLSEQIENPCLFVFSDDIEWVKLNFKTNIPTFFVERSDNVLLSDFRLMSMCKHNVIANSSYSWWAAWLNSNREKIVVAPKQWYQNRRKQSQTSDRVPKQWLRV